MFDHPTPFSPLATTSASIVNEILSLWRLLAFDTDILRWTDASQLADSLPSNKSLLAK